jgi:hypothetical protein
MNGLESSPMDRRMAASIQKYSEGRQFGKTAGFFSGGVPGRPLVRGVVWWSVVESEQTISPPLIAPCPGRTRIFIFTL